MFAQPIFETAEKWVVEAKLGIAQHPALMRALVRCSYVAATCAVAILVPFFNDINGCATSSRKAPYMQIKQLYLLSCAESAACCRGTAFSAVCCLYSRQP